MTPSPWPQGRKETLCSVNGGLVPHEGQTKQLGPAFSFKSSDAFVLKDKTLSEQLPPCSMGKGPPASLSQGSWTLAPARVRVTNSPGRIPKRGAFNLGPMSQVPSCLLRTHLLTQNSLRRHQREMDPHTRMGTLPQTNPPNGTTCFLKSDRLFSCPAGRRSLTPDHLHPITDTQSLRQAGSASPSMRTSPLPPPSCTQTSQSSGWASPRVSGAAGHYYLCLGAPQACIILNSN